MRITASRGEHSVTVEIEGASPKLLRQAEATALRLLGDVPEGKPETPIGFHPPAPDPAPEKPSRQPRRAP